MRLLARLAIITIAALATVIALPASPVAAADAGVEAEFVAAINRVRAGAGLPALEVHPELVAGARSWADSMAAAGAISHRGDLSGGISAPWTLLGENVGVGVDVASLVQAFVDSAPHYRNIVEARFDFIGVGVTWGSDGRMYTTHAFMDAEAPPAPRPAPPAPAAQPTAAPVAAPVAAPPVPVAAAAPVPPAPPAHASERVEAVLSAVRSLGAAGVA